MQFKLELIQAMRDGHKTQTRRVKRENEGLFWTAYEYFGRQALSDRLVPGGILTVVILEGGGQVGCIKWQVGRRYAIQPGRGKKAVGSYECMGLREERLQDISPGDTMVDGNDFNYVGPDQLEVQRRGFINLWDGLHKPGERWADNPTVWVIEMGKFEWEGK